MNEFPRSKRIIYAVYPIDDDIEQNLFFRNLLRIPLIPATHST